VPVAGLDGIVSGYSYGIAEDSHLASFVIYLFTLPLFQKTVKGRRPGTWARCTRLQYRCTGASYSGTLDYISITKDYLSVPPLSTDALGYGTAAPGIVI
jgi:hypothetical protein